MLRPPRERQSAVLVERQKWPLLAVMGTGKAVGHRNPTDHLDGPSSRAQEVSSDQPRNLDRMPFRWSTMNMKYLTKEG